MDPVLMPPAVLCRSSSLRVQRGHAAPSGRRVQSRLCFQRRAPIPRGATATGSEPAADSEPTFSPRRARFGGHLAAEADRCRTADAPSPSKPDLSAKVDRDDREPFHHPAVKRGGARTPARLLPLSLPWALRRNSEPSRFQWLMQPSRPTVTFDALGATPALRSRRLEEHAPTPTTRLAPRDAKGNPTAWLLSLASRP
jgi:hypothetical protein